MAQLRGQSLSAFQLFFLMTLGGARSLHLDDRVGSFRIGNEADFVVWNDRVTPLSAFRNPATFPESLNDLHDRLFSWIFLSDDRAVEAVYLLGKRVVAMI